MYVVEQTAEGVWTVGYWTPGVEWHGESDHTSKDEAVVRMRFLNGSALPTKPTPVSPPPPPAPAVKK